MGIELLNHQNIIVDKNSLDMYYHLGGETDEIY